ncbi:MAG TPA: carbon-nitrogen family hydrolase [Phycicoccus sp.]|jgi:predicted amidohydrolase|nr:carbon-nitrogen family hydrolase [Phycicoccus sp.]
MTTGARESRVFTVSVIQLAYGDEESGPDRIARARDLVRSAAQAKAGGPAPDLIVLPELWVATGFDYSKWEAAAEALDGPFVTAMQDLAREVGVVLHAGSFVERLPEPGPDGRTLANTSVLIGADGMLLASYRKIHRFGFGSGEPKLMEAGSGLVVVPLQLGGHEVRVALSTCYDLRFPEMFRLLGEAGAEVIVVPAAWPLPRVAHWQVLGQARAIEGQVTLIQCNTAGTHGGTVMGGHSQVVVGTGEVLGLLDHADGGVLTVTVDLSAQEKWRETFPVLADRRL